MRARKSAIAKETAYTSRSGFHSQGSWQIRRIDVIQIQLGLLIYKQKLARRSGDAAVGTESFTFTYAHRVPELPAVLPG
jgi:hypothetical protein